MMRTLPHDVKTVDNVRGVKTHEEFVGFVGPAYYGFEGFAHFDGFFLRYERELWVAEMLPFCVYGW